MFRVFTCDFSFDAYFPLQMGVGAKAILKIKCCSEPVTFHAERIDNRCVVSVRRGRERGERERERESRLVLSGAEMAEIESSNLNISLLLAALLKMNNIFLYLF